MNIIFDSFRNFFRNKIVLGFIFFVFLLNVYFWYLVRAFIDFSRDFHILHYNFYFGIDLIGSAQRLIYVPFLALSIFILNLVFSFFSYHYSKGSWIFAYLFLSLGTFINLQLLIYLIKIIGIEY